MYQLVTGPLVWVAFVGLIVGAIFKIVIRFRALNAERHVFPTIKSRFAIRSLLHWLVPFASRNMRLHPVMTIVSFAFHICLLLTPLFVMGHAVLWQRAWGVSWWSLPSGVADVMTLVVILSGAFFVIRRVVSPEVRIVSTATDYALVLLVIAPFLTGFIARQGWFAQAEITVIHAVTGVLWMVAIPFTRLSHMLWFAFSRSYMGSEFGAVRNARDW